MTADVLVIGEALIDIVASGSGPREFVGGSPANVAVGLARLGVPTRLLTRIGRDARGARIAEHVASAGVRLDKASWTDAATATAQARIAPDGTATYEFDVDWQVQRPVLDEVALVHAGSIGLFLEPGADAVLDTLEHAAHGGQLVTVDPNIRPALIGERGAAVRRFRRAVAAADLVRLSDEDAAWLYPDQQPEEALADIAARGPRLVVLTRGGRSTLALGVNGIVEAPVWPSDVADTIGAGDACMSSLIASALEDPLLFTSEPAAERALRRAAVAAGITVSRVGANPPTRDEVDAAM
ncbi:PfkB family carbohydrate kinase [Microbacterium invictum]|uniref:Fructokinase n=1 Tax=Microbacterium invictum TaxID=515415 RepID=A0AA40SPL0_9MICO|nr:MULTISPECIES: PfkB family carbohydrate kinase [Microbacterium]MBB4140080.1 fructokinase [Microbacterium invictum]